MVDARKLKILQAIISDYIATGEPVGSRTIAKKYDLGISPATIRNEMADLEDMGLLEQPYTSAGRVPSSKGYRLYVDKIMKYESVSIADELKIKKQLVEKHKNEIDALIHEVSTLLSELTNLTCLVNPPSVNKSCINSIQLMKVADDTILCVIVMDGSIIKNKLVKIKEKVPEMDILNKVSIVLTETLKNLSISQINLEVIANVKMYLESYSYIFDAILPALYETLKNVGSNDIIMEGATNIFNYPEYNDINKAKEMLELLHNKENMTSLMDSSKGITIKIGDENFIPEAKDCSVISANYSIGGRDLGTIALIGPRRINYSKVLSIMEKVMKEFNEALNEDD
ncbi:heat-inducible transcriptional repressor HrcA [uncultured Clostridium sp.]|jgi:heat-inducible transcriptional repressor|uniref:heat-inducible transcriptional repressor HrcA n=1 Tax=uncultured Clostridium sp. TaxID=59620 RepID=UPI00260761E3|nr:heat-inducible transcriptional repressor HrcA [uncultured Clostridium sp.]